jgi:hypothetical protein
MTKRKRAASNPIAPPGQGKANLGSETTEVQGRRGLLF